VTGPFDTNYDGMKFRLYPAENYCDRVLFGRSDLPEKAEHEALLPYLSEGMVFVDIGANIGSYSAFVGRKVDAKLILIAFEPHPRTYQKLIYNLKANDLPVEHVVNSGVGPEVSQMDLWSDGGSNIGHTSFLKEGTSNAKISHSVPIVPLVDVLHDQGQSRIDLLKIDIEGFEDQALCPFFDVAPSSLLPKTVLIEVAHQHLWQRDLMHQLSALGYQEVFKTKENRLLVRDE